MNFVFNNIERKTTSFWLESSRIRHATPAAVRHSLPHNRRGSSKGKRLGEKQSREWTTTAEEEQEEEEERCRGKLTSMSISCATSKAIVSAPPPSSGLMAPSGPRARPSLRFLSPLLFWFSLICLDSVSDIIFILMKLGFVNFRFLIWFFRSVSLVFFVMDWSFKGLGFTLALT